MLAEKEVIAREAIIAYVQSHPISHPTSVKLVAGLIRGPNLSIEWVEKIIREGDGNGR